MRNFTLLLLVLILTAGAAWAEFEPVTLKNAGLARTISGVANILKTSDIQVGDLSMLDAPSLEFMIELDYKGERLNLVPTDFDITGVDKATRGQEQITSVALRCHAENLPLLVYIDYIRDPKALYQQKSITIRPCKSATGAVIRRVTTESVQFKQALVPVSVDASGFGSDYKSAFAVVQQKSGRGVCFGATTGKAGMDRPRRFTACEETDAPAETGWQSGIVWFGAITGSPEAAFRAYRQDSLDQRYPALAKDAKLGALRKRFASCFAACQYLPPTGTIDAEGHIADNKGFILIFNSGSASAKAVLPLADAGLKLSGDAHLSDWTALDKPVDLGPRKLDEKVELDVEAHGYRIIGINVE